MISFDTYSQVHEDVACREVETVQVKGIKENIRTFEVVLDGSEEADKLSLKTDNVHCSIDPNNIDMNEIKQLAEFVEEAKRKLG